MTIKTKAVNFGKRMLSSRTVAVLLLTAICSGLFSIVAAAARIVDIHDGETVLKGCNYENKPE